MLKVVECGKEISLPINPTKEGYSFISWVDKNETPILDKALLACEEITIYARWKKEETKKQDNKQSTDNKKKTYKCPSGYTLNGTKCISEVSATDGCASGYTWSSKVNKCVAKTTAIDGDCPTGYVWSSSESVCVTFKDQIKTCVYSQYRGSGFLYDDGYCYHGTNPNAKSKTQCEDTYGNVWYNGVCYLEKSTPKTSCPEGYTLSGSKCTKTINATY